MAVSKLAILIETLYKGGAAGKAIKDMGALGQATSKATMQQAVMGARTADLNKVMGQLASDVSKGTISVQQATDDFNAYKKSLPVLEVEETTKKTMGMKEAFGKMALAAGAAAAAFVIAKKAFDLGAEGAQLQRTRDIFDRLAESIDTTAGTLMGKMREATMGMVSDTELMKASARTMSMGLASTGDEAAKLAEIAVKLGAAMGKEAGPAMEEFGLLLANQSTLRLDTFGISAARVKERITELTAATPGLSRETAFMQATMEQAEIAMTKLGDAMKPDAFSQMTAEVTNLKDELKILVSEGLGPTVGILATGLRATRTKNDVREIAESLGMTNKEIQDLIRNLDMSGDSWGKVHYYTQADRLKRYALAIDLIESGFSGTNEELIDYIDNTGRAEAAQDSAERSDQRMIATYREHKTVLENLAGIQDSWMRQIPYIGEEISNWDMAQSRLNSSLMDSWQRMGDVEIAAEGAADGIEDVGNEADIAVQKLMGLNAELLAAKARLEAIDGMEAIRITFEIQQIEAQIAGIQATHVELATPGTPGPTLGGPVSHSGADFIVPPGYPNDSYPMRVESGEHVQVTPRGKQGAGGATVNVTVYTGSGNPDLIGNKVAGRVAEVLGVRG